MIRTLLLPLLALLALTACSTKEYYSPEETVDESALCGTFDSASEKREAKGPVCSDSGAELVSRGAEGAVSENGEVIDSRGKSSARIKKGKRFLGISDGWVLSTGIDGNVTLQSRDGNRSVVMPLEKTVAAASVQGDYLAVLFASNDLGIYRLSTGKSYYKVQGTPVTAVDVRIASPYFLGTLVVFPTLDGRLVVVDYEHKELLRSTAVGSENYFGNIFYFNVIGDTMVAATSQHLFALSEQERRAKYDLRDVVFDKEGVWAATKEGEVLHMTAALQPIAKRKFPFAHFLGMIVGDKKLYLLEKEGYLIVMDKAMTQTEVYDVALDGGLTFTADKAFYAGDKIITVEP